VISPHSPQVRILFGLPSLFGAAIPWNFLTTSGEEEQTTMVNPQYTPSLSTQCIVMSELVTHCAPGSIVSYHYGYVTEY